MYWISGSLKLSPRQTATLSMAFANIRTPVPKVRDVPAPGLCCWSQSSNIKILLTFRNGIPVGITSSVPHEVQLWLLHNTWILDAYLYSKSAPGCSRNTRQFGVRSFAPLMNNPCPAAVLQWSQIPSLSYIRRRRITHPVHVGAHATFLMLQCHLSLHAQWW